MKEYAFAASHEEVVAKIGRARNVYTLFPFDGSLLSRLEADGWKNAGSSLKRPDRAYLWLSNRKRRAYVGLASTWFGQGSYSVDQAESVMAAVQIALFRRLEGARLLHSPGATGVQALREQWVRAGWHVQPQSLEVQAMARQCGQGRVECCPVVDEVPAVVQSDMSLAYLRMAQQVSWGDGWKVERRPDGGWPDDERGARHSRCDGYLGHWPALYAGVASPPFGWSHVGLLPCPGNGGWEWPASGGFTFRATGYELRIALEFGWGMQVTHRAAPTSPSTCDVLRTWAKHVIAMVDLNPYLGCGPDAALYRMYRHAARAIGLHAIGVLNAAPKTITRRAETLVDVPDDDLAHETVTAAGDGWEYESRAAITDKTQSAAHPEIAALVYGKTRAALLHHRMAGGQYGGASSIPREWIIGFGTDCIYTTADPGLERPLWAVKGEHVGPFPRPKTMADIWSITKEAEA